MNNMRVIYRLLYFFFLAIFRRSFSRQKLVQIVEWSRREGV